MSWNQTIEYMFRIDASDVPSEITDFAFDRVSDVLESDAQSCVSFDYDSQTVSVDSEDEELADSVLAMIKSQATAKTADMIIGAREDHDVDYSVDELESVSTDIREGCITIEQQ